MVWLIVLGVALVGLGVYDLLQTRHAILRNFPVIGHLRYLLEAVGPELRQYIVTDNDEERPFSRDQRRWIYASAKKQNTYFGFGTDNDVEAAANYLVVKHSAFPRALAHAGEPGYDPLHPIPCAKVMGAWRERKHAFRPASAVYVSAMSFGSLSAAAIEAINRGCKLAGAMHNTGEGGISPHHAHGGDLIWQLGTGYFGARSAGGGFDLARVVDQVQQHPVRAIEIKLSQGAKPGLGGLLPGAKVTATIAAIRGIPQGQDCASPASHRAFSNVDEMLDFIERIADATGLPVGIKSAVGDLGFWDDLSRLMDTTGRGPDYIHVDGGEGGTGAAPLAFADHVALPFKMGFSRVYPAFAARGLHEKIIFVGAGRLGLPVQATLAMSMGCDMVAVAREALISIGCIQAQRCHTGHCPAGVATQSAWLMRGLDPTSKSARLANYLVALRKEMRALAHACGRPHPALLTLDDFEILDGRLGSSSGRAHFGYQPGWGLPGEADRAFLEG